MSSKTVDENYRRLRAELDELLSNDKRLTAIADKISKGTADFSDTALYTQIVSKHMSDVIKHNIGELKLPMAKEMVCKELLRDHYELINGVFGEVQVRVDEKLGIHLNPIKPAYPAERVDSWAHSLEDPTVEPSVTERRAASGSENIGNSIHDDCVKENAKVREQAGLDCYLTRDVGGGCCPWCQALEGRYSYADAPDDIFRRHDNCTCTVTYECGRKRQQVWSKQDWSNNKEREYLKRLDAEKAAKRKALSDNSKPKVNSKDQAEAINEQSKSDITVLSKEQAKAINVQNQPIVFTEAEAKEREAKALGKDDNVNNKSVDNSDKSGIIKAERYPNDNFSRKAQLMSVQEDLKATNPKFNIEPGYDDNCQRCVPTYAYRRRGYNVEALPAGENPEIDRYLKQQPYAIWEREGSTVLPIGTAGSKYYGKPEIEKYMKELPDGAMCEVLCDWRNSDVGHVFVAEKIAGKIHYIDPQTGDDDVSRYFEMIHPGTLFWRIDNANVDDKLIKFCCK